MDQQAVWRLLVRKPYLNDQFKKIENRKLRYTKYYGDGDRKLRYTKYYGDGDSKSFQAIENTYDNMKVKKNGMC